AIEMESILDTANRETGFELFKVASGYGPSDHQSFYSKNIPVLFFFTGLHNDYHRPSDDFDKINFNGMARVTDITSGVAALLATRPTRPQYAATERDASIRWQARGYLGVQLGEAGDGGVLVSGLMPGGAAEKAGILVGDRLNRFNDSIIRSTGEALELIQARDPGDPLEIELLRGVETLTVTAVLQSRPAER
ncbi:MAG: M28 family peptidase, partial [Planctomycetaceae bacterium]